MQAANIFTLRYNYSPINKFTVTTFILLEIHLLDPCPPKRIEVNNLSQKKKKKKNRRKQSYFTLKVNTEIKKKLYIIYKLNFTTKIAENNSI